jgi:hypothetical protein
MGDAFRQAPRGTGASAADITASEGADYPIRLMLMAVDCAGRDPRRSSPAVVSSL